MAEFAEATFEKVAKKLTEHRNTLILFHRNPDADAVGSAFALKEILGALGSPAYCVCSSEVPERIRFLTGGRQQTVLPESIPEGFRPERIVAVDTASPAQLGSLYETFGNSVDLMIDHHGSGTPFADHYIRPDAAATGEIIFDLAKHYEKEGLLTLSEQICSALYGAISSDTGGFRYSNVTAGTHQRAAVLVESGINCAEINRLLFDCKSPELLRAESAGVANLRTYADGKLAVIAFPYTLKKAMGLSDEHLETLVDIARSVRGTEVALAVRQPGEEGVFRVSARSNGDYDVASLCSQFGGGGHKKAAGCTLEAADIDAAIARLTEAVQFR